MSNLTLKITADTAGLAEIKTATAELKALLGTSQVPSLAAIQKLTTNVRALEAATQKSKAASDASAVSLAGVSAAASGAKKTLDLTTASYSKLSLVTHSLSSAIKEQKVVLTDNLSQMSAMSWATKVQAQNLQALAGVVAALDAEFTKQTAVKTAIIVKTNEQVLAEKNLTQTLLAQSVASGKLSTAEAVRLGYKKPQIDATAALAASEAKMLAIKIASAKTSSVSPAAIAALKKQALAAANSAAALGAMTRAEVEAIAVSNGLANSLTTRLVPALNAAALSSSTLKDATRGAAGAGGSLWMAYGQVIPLMGAFVTVASTIKGVKLSAEYEAQTVFMNALAEATGDYSMTLTEVQATFLDMRGLTHTVSELATASKELVKAGFSSVQATAEIADMSKTATVAQEELELVTRGVAAQYRAWGVNAVGTERGVSSLKETANMMGFAALKTALDFGELNSMLAHTTELGPLTGATFGELTGLLGFMSNMGIKGTKAATSLRTGMLRLQSMSGSLKTTMEGLRVPFNAFTESGELKSLTIMFEDLGRSLEPLSNEARIDVLNKIFNLRALKGGVAGLRALSDSVDEGTFSFRELVAGIDEAGTSLQFIDNLYAELIKTTEGLWQVVQAETVTEMTKAFKDTNGEVYELLTVLRSAIADGTLLSIVEGLAATARGLVWTTTKVVEMRTELEYLAKVQVLGPLLGNLLEAKRLLEDDTGKAEQFKDTLVGVSAPHLFGPLFGNLIYAKRLLDNARGSAKALKDEATGIEFFDPEAGRIEAAGLEGKKTATGGDALPDLKALALAQWGRQEKIKVERDAIQSIAQLRAAAGADTLSLLNAQFKAQSISEESFIEQSRAIRSSDLSARISEGVAKLDLLKKEATSAKVYADDNLKDQSAQIALAAALRKVRKAASDLGVLKGKKLLEPLVAEEEDIARTKKFVNALQGVRDTARDIQQDAERVGAIAVMDDGQARLAEKLLQLDRKRIAAVQELKDAQVDADDERYQMVNDAYNSQTEAVEEYYRREQELRASWSLGIEKSLADYVYEAQDSYSQIGGVITNAFQGAEDAILKFVETGKLSFTDLAESIIKDLNRILIKKAIAGLVEYAVSSYATAGSEKTVVPEFTGDVSSARTIASANGNVFTSSALSELSGTIVNQPTIFPFANGIGLAGEAGDEAILPLKRGRGGKLGVVAQSGKEGIPNIEINVYNQDGEKKEAESNAKLDVKGLVVDIFLTDMSQNGPMKRAIKGSSRGGL